MREKERRETEKSAKQHKLNRFQENLKSKQKSAEMAKENIPTNEFLLDID